MAKYPTLRVATERLTSFAKAFGKKIKDDIVAKRFKREARKLARDTDLRALLFMIRAFKKRYGKLPRKVVRAVSGFTKDDVNTVNAGVSELYNSFMRTPIHYSEQYLDELVAKIKRLA